MRPSARGADALFHEVPRRAGPAQVRRWAFALAVGVGALAAYVTLVPFNFARPDGPWLETFRSHLERGVGSRGNFLANLLLFVPIGFGLTAAMAGAGHWGRRFAAAIVAVALGSALSVAIEFLQMLVPGRTPSLADIWAQAIGSGVGAFVWIGWARDIEHVAAIWFSRERASLVPALLALYTIGRVLILLWPLDVSVDLGYLAQKVRDGGIVLNPLRSPVLRLDLLSTMMLVAIFSVPAGVYVSIAGVARGRRRSVGSSLLLALVLFGLVEAAQVFIRSTRADAAQWLVNFAGAAAGVLIARGLFTARDGGDVRPQPRWLAAIAPVGAMLLYAVYHWSPFDFALRSDVIEPRIGRLFRAPFHSYYENPEFTALAGIVVKLAVSAPIGVALAWWLSRFHGPQRRLLAVATGVAAVGFVTAVEIGQVALPGRYPDNTDILLATLGIALGWWMTGLMGFDRR